MFDLTDELIFTNCYLSLPSLNMHLRSKKTRWNASNCKNTEIKKKIEKKFFQHQQLFTKSWIKWRCWEWIFAHSPHKPSQMQYVCSVHCFTPTASTLMLIYFVWQQTPVGCLENTKSIVISIFHATTTYYSFYMHFK